MGGAPFEGRGFEIPAVVSFWPTMSTKPALSGARMGRPRLAKPSQPTGGYGAGAPSLFREFQRGLEFLCSPSPGRGRASSSCMLVPPLSVRQSVAVSAQGQEMVKAGILAAVRDGRMKGGSVKSSAPSATKARSVARTRCSKKTTATKRPSTPPATTSRRKAAPPESEIAGDDDKVKSKKRKVLPKVGDVCTCDVCGKTSKEPSGSSVCHIRGCAVPSSVGPCPSALALSIQPNLAWP